MKQLKHVKVFEAFRAESSYRVEDTCERGEKAIVFQDEDYLAYGIVSEDDAKRISNAVREFERLNKDPRLDVRRYQEFGPGTTHFTFNANGEIHGHSGTPNPNEFEYLNYTNGEAEDGLMDSDYNPAFTLTRDHITSYYSNSGVVPSRSQTVDSLIDYILR